jgi:MFS family permease
VDDSARGAVLGLYQSSISLAIIISTAIAGVIFAADPALPYWIGAGLSLGVLLPGLYLLRLARQGALLPKEKVAL